MTALPQVEGLLEAMTQDLRHLIAPLDTSAVVMIGIHSGGVWVAQRLHKSLGLATPLGSLDISFYRDDFSRIGMHPRVRPSELPFTVEDRTVILVDDVLYSGRTVRAALNEIFDYGRPAAVRLVVLLDRSGRELPVAADVSGARVELAADQQIKLRGPDPLQLTLQQRTP